LIKESECVLNDIVLQGKKALRKYGYIKTLELVVDKCLQTLNPVSAYNRWRFKRSCTRFGKGVEIRGRVDARARDNGKIIIGDYVVIEGPLQLWVRDNAKIVIGNNCRLDSYVRLDGAWNSVIELGEGVNVGAYSMINSSKRVSIGAHTLISCSVNIIDVDHGISRDKLIKDQLPEGVPIEIGDDVWIGWGAAVLKGVKIGKGAVVGAGSMVTVDVSPYSVVAGVPARKIKTRE